MKTKIIIFAVLLLTPMILTQNCSKVGSTPAGNLSPASLTDAPQPPQIQCQVQTTSGNALSTFGNSAGAAAGIAPIVTGSSVQFNCGQSSGEFSDASQLTYQITNSSGQSVASFNGGVISSVYVAGAPGQLPLNITVTDPTNGTSATMPFTMYIQCKDKNTLAYTGSGVSVAATGNASHYNYSIAAGSFSFGANPPAGVCPNGGACNPNFSYAVDFNGDGVVDPADFAGDQWSSPASAAGFSFTNIFNAYININANETRTIHVLAMDQNCSYVADSGPIQVNFYNAANNYLQQPVTYMPPASGNYFIQADIVDDNAAESTEADTNAHILYTSIPSDTHVDCTPEESQKGATTIAFSVEGSNAYDHRDGAPLANLKVHFSNLSYPNQIGVTGPIKTYTNIASILGQNPPDGSTMDAATYTSIEDGASEASAAVPFSFQTNMTNCSYQIQVQRKPGGTPCNDGTKSTMDTMTYVGSFSCDPLVSSIGKSVSAAKNGFFFCEANIGDMCVGGGGQSSGGVPIFEH